MRQSYLVIVGLLFTLYGTAAAAGEIVPDPEVYYVTDERGAVYEKPGDEFPQLLVGFRDQVEVLDKNDRWTKVRTSSGVVGYMRTRELSNVWIRVDKTQGKVYVYRGSKLIRTIAADFGYNVTDDKVKRGSREEPDHWRTPEGRFYITNKNPNSQYYKALVINYPTAKDAHRGLREGLISEDEHAEIIRAATRFERPPMNTRLGGWIEIHGEGTGGRINWTQGCIAIKNSQLDAIWDIVSRGTPVIIE